MWNWDTASASRSAGCVEPVFTGWAMFRTNCSLLNDRWPANEKAQSFLTQKHNSRTCLFSIQRDAEWNWVTLSITQCLWCSAESAGRAGDWQVTPHQEPPSGAFSCGFPGLVPASSPHALEMASMCEAQCHPAAIIPPSPWARHSNYQVKGRTFVLHPVAPCPMDAVPNWSFASQPPPPVTEVGSSDASFTERTKHWWVGQKKICQRCTTGGIGGWEESRSSCWSLWNL